MQHCSERNWNVPAITVTLSLLTASTKVVKLLTTSNCPNWLVTATAPVSNSLGHSLLCRHISLLLCSDRPSVLYVLSCHLYQPNSWAVLTNQLQTWTQFPGSTRGNSTILITAGGIVTMCKANVCHSELGLNLPVPRNSNRVDSY